MTQNRPEFKTYSTPGDDSLIFDSLSALFITQQLLTHIHHIVSVAVGFVFAECAPLVNGTLTDVFYQDGDINGITLAEDGWLHWPKQRKQRIVQALIFCSRA